VLTALALVLVGLVGFTTVTGPAQAADVDCSDFSTQAEAQRYLFPGDPNRLDADGDGKACDSLPCPCSYGNPTPPKPTPTSKPKPQPKPQPKPEPQVLRVVSVIKGDVVSVRLGKAKAYRVHLLGTTVPKSSCEAKASKSYLKSYLKPGAVVRANVDKKAPNRDKKGVLRHLIKKDGGYNIGLTQVADGYAKTDRTVNFSFKAKYIKSEKKAKAQSKGYYATC
jgi:endonuclease YncB( thermonuclease family)